MEGGGGGGHAREQKQACSLQPQLEHLGAQGLIRNFSGMEPLGGLCTVAVGRTCRNERAGVSWAAAHIFQPCCQWVREALTLQNGVMEGRGCSVLPSHTALGKSLVPPLPQVPHGNSALPAFLAAFLCLCLLLAAEGPSCLRQYRPLRMHVCAQKYLKLF